MNITTRQLIAELQKMPPDQVWHAEMTGGCEIACHCRTVWQKVTLTSEQYIPYPERKPEPLGVA